MQLVDALENEENNIGIEGIHSASKGKDTEASTSSIHPDSGLSESTSYVCDQKDTGNSSLVSIPRIGGSKDLDSQNTDKDEAIDSESESLSISDNEEESDGSTLELYGYQRELADKVFNENAIICLGTGTGKTRLALQVIKNHLQTLNGQGKVAFMGTHNILVKQQLEKCKKLLPQYSTMIILSENDGQSMILDAFIPYHDILFFTPQILVNNIENKTVDSIGRFTLLVFDECHHTKGDNPYNNIMRKYLIEKKIGNKLPQILGLTASIGVGKSVTESQACDYILRICARMDVKKLPKVEKYTEELEEHTATPKEEILRFLDRPDDPCKRILISAIEHIEQEVLLDIALSQPLLLMLIVDKCPQNKQSMEYNNWTVEVKNQATQMENDPQTARDIIACAEYLNTFSAALEVNRLLGTNDVVTSILLKHQQQLQNTAKLSTTEALLLKKLKDTQKDILKKCRNITNPNISTMSKLLREMILEKGTEDSRAMVFVKTRATCKSLANVLGKDFESIPIRVRPLYGKGKRGNEEGMDEKDQTDIVEKFREGYYSVLVATAIGTEGIDIPNCNIALCYDYSEDEVRKLQMKGRTRKKDGIIVTLGSEKTIKREQVNVYKIALMQRGLELARSRSYQEFARNVNFFQQEEMQNYEVKQQIQKAAEERQKANVDFALECIKCSTFACNISDVRKLKVHHIVANRSFADKIAERPLTSKWKGFDGFRKQFKLGCKTCTNDWGVAALIDGLPCHVLQLANFKFYDRSKRERKPIFFSKWQDVPYQVNDITPLELSSLTSGD